jgi:hypothetical protein
MVLEVIRIPSISQYTAQDAGLPPHDLENGSKLPFSDKKPFVFWGISFLILE